MGDARAAEAKTPSFVPGALPGRWGRWAIAVAAGAAVIGGLAFTLSSDDKDDLETVDDTDVGSFQRWIPASGVGWVEYPGEFGLWVDLIGWRQVALVAPMDPSAITAADYTRILASSSWPQAADRPATDYEISRQRSSGTIELDLTRSNGEFTVASIETTRFSAAELESHAEELVPLATDLQALAEAVASWDDELEVLYVGDPVQTDAVIRSEPDEDSSGLLWVDTKSAAQFAATYGPPDQSRDFLLDFFALSDADGFALTDEYWSLNLPDELVAVNEREWIEIIEQLLGPDPEVTFPGSELFALSPGPGGLEGSKASAASDSRGFWTVRLELADPFTFRDGGAFVIEVGPVSLTFGPAVPGEPFEILDVPSRLAQEEAERYADEINAALPEAPQSADPPNQAGVCAANPVPDDDVLELATHINFDRAPLDIDQDGIDDEMLVYDDEDGNWWLIGYLQTGWTNALNIGQPTVPGLALTSEGVPAATDLDGDGQLEFFVTGYLGPTAGLVTLRGCELIDSFFLDEPASENGASFGVQIGLADDTPLCRSRGCATRVRCVGNVLSQELLIGVAPNDASGEWVTVEVRLEPNGELTTTELPPVIVGTVSRLDDPPTEATTGVIDCSPDQESEPAQIVRPACIGNSGPPDGSDPMPMVSADLLGLDVDGDGFDDEPITFVGDDGRVRLVLHLGDDNYTNAVPVWFDGRSQNQRRPGLVATPDGQIAASDLTGNGSTEFFVGGFGNTARSARVLGLEGCVLRVFADERTPEHIEEAFGVLIGVGGNSCAPTGCTPRVSCIDRMLVTENTSPVEAFDPDVPLSEVEVQWTTTVWEYVNETFVIASETEATFFATERPADAPNISDVIDCRP